MARVTACLLLQAAFAYATKSCCDSLSAALGDKVSLPGSARYNLTELSYDALQEASLQPTCIFRPSSTEDVSRAITILTKPESGAECQFAIKSGGHNAAVGFANINDGVTFDLTSMASVEVSKDRATARVGSGAKWVDVYAALEPYNITVVGGRNGNVGVGGLLVGGGISHFSPKKGWACDQVVNFEVVLGDGSIVNANSKSHVDLYSALKGGANNFGVVTRFDLKAFPQGNVASTLLFNDASHRHDLFKAFINITTARPFDTHTSLVMSPIYNSTTKSWQFLNIAVYTKPDTNPAVYKDLFAVPSISNTTRISSVAVLSDEAQGPPSNTIFATVTFKPSLQLMLETFDILDGFFKTFDIPGGIHWVAAFEPLVAGLTHPASAKGGNVLGLGPEDTGVVLLLSPGWSDSGSNKAVEKATKHAISLIEEHAKSKGLLQDFQYLNYANYDQHPLQSYGSRQLKFLQDVSRKYDEKRVFQKQVPGGFKLW